jgi:hypothetical protein
LCAYGLTVRRQRAPADFTTSHIVGLASQSLHRLLRVEFLGRRQVVS